MNQCETTPEQYAPLAICVAASGCGPADTTVVDCLQGVAVNWPQQWNTDDACFENDCSANQGAACTDNQDCCNNQCSFGVDGSGPGAGRCCQDTNPANSICDFLE